MHLRPPRSFIGSLSQWSLFTLLLVTACNDETATTASPIEGETMADGMTPGPDAGIGLDTEAGSTLATGGTTTTPLSTADASLPAPLACMSAPTSWTCDPCRFEDGVCDCNCGAPDPACPAAECKVVPSTWTCDHGMFMDGACDCACGAWDPDCDVDASTDDCAAGVCVQPGMCELMCTLTAPSLPTPGQFAAPNYSVEANTAIVFFHNAGDLTITDLRVSPSTSGTWGVNQLGAETIVHDNYYAMRGVPCGVNMDIQTRALTSTGTTSSPAEQIGVQFVCNKRQVLLLP